MSLLPQPVGVLGIPWVVQPSMSTKQALREFQNRLTERLQSARTSGVAASWLAVEAGSSRLLLPLSHAGEIFAWTQVRPVPYAQPWFMGVANLRGGLFGVVDLVAFVGSSFDVERSGHEGAPQEPGQAMDRSEVQLGQCHLVALNPLLDVNCAVLVDRLLGLRTTGAFAASASPAAGSPPYFGHVYTDAAGVEWQEINLQSLSQHSAFLSIGA